MTATPVWLGSEDRPLFGWMHVPENGRASGAVVICPTLGLEAVYSYWTLRELANRLAAAGLVALRFDYDGTGDSSGDWDDPDRVTAWLASVKTAIDHVRNLGVGRVAVVGLRVGGTLAAETLAAEVGIADDLVLWDPCASGRSFLREQRALWAFLRNQAVEWGILDEDASWGVSHEATKVDDGSVESPGLIFSKDAVVELEGLSIAGTEGALAGRILCLTRDTRRPERRMAERLAHSGVEWCEVTGQDDLLAVTAVMPVETITRIVEWLSEPLASQVPVEVEAPRVAAAVVDSAHKGHAIVERPIQLNSTHLFGMLTEPGGGAAQHLPTIMFLNAGRINHVGPGRLWVEMSRKLSRHGFRCLRFDLAGIGDSPTRPGRTDQVEYPTDALIDLSDARSSVVGLDDTNVVLVGVCSGGYHAVESALDQRVRAICAVNPILTFFMPGRLGDRNFEPLEEGGFSNRQSRSSTRRWSQSVTQMSIVPRLVRRMPEAMWWMVNRLFVKAIPARTLKRLTGLGANILIVAGSNEARVLSRGEGRTIRNLTQSKRFRLDTIPFLEHSLLERTGREHVAHLMSAFLVEKFGAEKSDGISPDGVSAVS
jgi:alpha-beta hydrolase superfamily lysophospholipase